MEEPGRPERSEAQRRYERLFLERIGGALAELEERAVREGVLIKEWFSARDTALLSQLALGVRRVFTEVSREQHGKEPTLETQELAYAVAMALLNNAQADALTWLMKVVQEASRQKWEAAAPGGDPVPAPEERRPHDGL